MANAKNGRSGKKLEKYKLAILTLVITLLVSASLTGCYTMWPVSTETTIPSTHKQEYTEGIDGNLQVHMINVGQADSFLLVQEGNVALVDCGTRSTGKDAVEYIKGLDITKIDYVFGTHPHDDHMGGMYDIITNFEIGKIILPKVSEGQVTTNWYIKLMKQIVEGGYEVEYSQTGNMYQLGKAVIKILWQSNEPQKNVNNYSNIMKVSFGEMDIIMTGDAETEIEKEVINAELNLEAEIIKIGHHGSDTSSSDEFLNEVNPQYALISAKLGNKYNHPTEITMKKLQQRNIIVYRTDECDTVIATITANGVTFSSKPGDYLSGTELEAKKAS